MARNPLPSLCTVFVPSVLVTSLRLVFFPSRWLLMLLIHRNPGLPVRFVPVIFILIIFSSHHMTIPSQFIYLLYLDHFYNWSDLALHVETSILLFVPFSDTLYHLETPCFIRMAFLPAAMIRLSNLFVNVQYSLPKMRIGIQKVLYNIMTRLS